MDADRTREELERTVRELRESESRFRLIADQAPVLIWVADRSNGVTWLNKVWLDFVGRPLEALLGDGWTADVHPDDRRRCREARAGSFERREHSAITYRLRRADGTWRWVLDRGNPVRNRGGEFSESIGSCVDFTEQKISEDRLFDANQRLQALMNALPVGVSFSDDATAARITGNPTLLEQFEVGPQDNISASAPEETAPGRQVRFFRDGFEIADRDLPLQKAIAENRSVPAMEIEVEMPSGRRWYAEASGAPLRDAGGEVVGGVAVTLDITERKFAEQALAELADSKERERRVFDTVLSNTVDINFVFDLEGRFTFANKALLTLWGLTDLEQARGKTPAELHYPPELARRLRRQVYEVVATRKPLRDSTPYVAVGRSEARQYEYIFVPVFAGDGTVEAVAGSTRDVTDSRRTEATLRDQAEQLREVDRRKDVFLATLAHELRNPLAPVLTGLHVLNRTRDETAAAPIRAMMDRQLLHMVRLIDDLLDISRITSGKVKLKRERVALQSVCEIAVEGCRPTIDQAGHLLAFEFPAEPIWVEADATRAAQIVVNLLTNAAKYTPDGGRIALRCGSDTENAFVAVSDTGLGIPPELLADVFQMFTQVNRTLDRSQGGLGIGLALVKKLVELHGGTIEAASEGIGRGSTFTVRLPLLDPLRAPNGSFAPPVSKSEAPPRPLRILVIDDNRDAAESLALLLELQGHAARAVFSGADALELAAKGTFELVFCDLGLPGLNGFEVARRWRRLPEPRPCTLVALTGWGTEEDKRQSREAGFDHHLVKPVGAAEIEAIIRNVGFSKP